MGRESHTVPKRTLTVTVKVGISRKFQDEEMRSTLI